MQLLCCGVHTLDISLPLPHVLWWFSQAGYWQICRRGIDNRCELRGKCSKTLFPDIKSPLRVYKIECMHHKSVTACGSSVSWTLYTCSSDISTVPVFVLQITHMFLLIIQLHFQVVQFLLEFCWLWTDHTSGDIQETWDTDEWTHKKKHAF